MAHSVCPARRGFASGKTTIKNLVDYTNYLINNMMKGGRIYAICIDLAKTFDLFNNINLNKKITIISNLVHA